MRRLLRALATLGLAAALARFGTDERNVRRLARHVGCSTADARRLYRRAREIGYGAAYVEVFGTSAPAGSPPSDPAAATAPAAVATDTGRPAPQATNLGAQARDHAPDLSDAGVSPARLP